MKPKSGMTSLCWAEALYFNKINIFVVMIIIRVVLFRSLVVFI